MNRTPPAPLTPVQLKAAAAAVVMTLKVEPGGKVCCVATSPSGGKPLALFFDILLK